ncbi:unnamed protein product [Hydatigera taeniaeformis]|uniref:G_PROTEIN_RECEP_F1_2 domain-containing protein n=1 Tax=Hydatigena taeniaeformis TaxID=6205 RepID=A0A0R3X5Z0_HYDTA|nr:unnamed protein product [Hydatigera taeniaeformis]
MQNNLIACTIIVFLCIISSIVIGAISVLARMVPAAMVNAFLYLTACKFHLLLSPQLPIIQAVLTASPPMRPKATRRSKLAKMRSPVCLTTLNIWVKFSVRWYNSVECVFIIFANCIEHIKVNHIQSKWGPCYPIVSLPPDLYDPTLIRVQYGWSVYVNWIVVGVFLASASVWFVLKQFLYVETAKAMI